MPVGRLFLSCISYNVKSQGQAYENLSDIIFCIPRDFLPTYFSSQQDPEGAERVL